MVSSQLNWDYRTSRMSVEHPESRNVFSPSIVGKKFIVQCQGYRCLAYLDADYKWHACSNDEEIEGVMGILSDVSSLFPVH